MTTDSSGAYDSQSQPYSVSNTFGESGSQGESQERRSSFLNSNGKRGFSVARPPSGPATVGHISKESSSVSAYLNSVTKSGQHARAPSPVFGKMRPTAMIGSNKGASTTLPSPHGVPQGDLDSVVSALRDRQAPEKNQVCNCAFEQELTLQTVFDEQAQRRRRIRAIKT